MNAEWTVMVFLNGDNNLEKYALQDFREMAKVGSTEKVNVIAQFDRNGVYEVTTPQWSDCLRFRIEKDMEPIPANSIERLGEVNMGKGEVLASFVRWAIQNFPANRYMLDVWDHGQGWRVAEARPVRGTIDEIAAYREFRRNESAKEIEAKSKRRARPGRRETEDINSFEDATAIPAGSVIESSYRYISVDDSSNDKLYNREIQDSLLEVLNGDQIDLIGFDACLMGMIETGFAMRKFGKVMVASQEVEPGEGWDYSDWLQHLVDNPTIDEVALGKVLVAAYERAYADNDSDVTLSAVDLKQMDNLAALVGDLANELIQKMSAELANIKRARSSCKCYAPGLGLHGIDLARFCDQLRGATLDTSVRSKAQAIGAAIQSCVISNYAGVGRQGNFGSNGIGIYFPATRSLFNTDPDHQGYLQGNTFYPVEFVQAHKWDNFLQSYYALVP